MLHNNTVKEVILSLFTDEETETERERRGNLPRGMHLLSDRARNLTHACFQDLFHILTSYLAGEGTYIGPQSRGAAPSGLLLCADTLGAGVTSCLEACSVKRRGLCCFHFSEGETEVWIVR